MDIRVTVSGTMEPEQLHRMIMEDPAWRALQEMRRRHEVFQAVAAGVVLILQALSVGAWMMVLFLLMRI